MIDRTPQTMRALRRITRTPQGEAAEIVGVSRSSVNKYEHHGLSLSPAKVDAIITELVERARPIAKAMCECPLCGARVE